MSKYNSIESNRIMNVKFRYSSLSQLADIYIDTSDSNELINNVETFKENKMGKKNKLYIFSFIIICSLFGVWVIRVIGSRILIRIYSIDIFIKFLQIISYFSLFLSLLLILILITIMITNYKFKYSKIIILLSTINTILAVLIQIIKFGFGIYVRQVIDNRINFSFQNYSINEFVSFMSYLQSGVILIMYIAIIIMMIISIKKIKMENKNVI